MTNRRDFLKKGALAAAAVAAPSLLTSCHPERSEGCRFFAGAQNDKNGAQNDKTGAQNDKNGAGFVY